MVRAIIVAALASLALTGCSSDLVGKADKLAARACECETAECAEKVNKEFESFLSGAVGERVSENDKTDLAAAAGKLGECIASHTGGGETGKAGASDSAAE